ncbi:unnamed protein product [Bemisia tabaci]|uniref:SH3 domain-containing protein n=1 Tax=Bemisia tabaci TaxID=7038 RepID=A0A9P0A4T4_BEMTA|nr:unnamed protein product [Bemisia tabaci]
MVTPAGNGCNLPTRPAPAPPGSSISRGISSLDLGSDKKHAIESSRPSSLANQFRSHSMCDVSKKKKPPPRPPPPKIDNKNKIQNRTTVLSNLFSRKNSFAASRPAHIFNPEITKAVHVPSVPVASLIDLHSPPSSPTLTTRSSSDGVSVDSLSSDNGNTSASGNYGTGSQVESGFEDDFALFPTSLSLEDTTKPVTDPFSPLPKSACVNPTFQLSNEDPKLKVKMLDTPAVRNPTIIRTKQSKAPLRPPLPVISQNSSESLWAVPSSSCTQPSESIFDFPDDFSPPMPSVPPPPPPAEVLQVLCSGPPVPPRPSFEFKPSKRVENEKPYCIALYDYNADVESDLSFKEKDVILLTREVNEEWFMGCLNGREGMFPSNYVEVKVPLNSADSSSSENRKVIAIFDFHAESWDDLDFKEGDEVTVLETINQDWLYGEIGDKRGQFPSSFVSPLPDS